MNPYPGDGSMSAVAAAVQWIEATLLGTIATSIAVIAVGCVGLLLLSGRIDIRRGGQVVFGCFILFGASAVAAGIMRVVASSEGSPEAAAPASSPPPVYAAPAAKRPLQAVPYDPYAGAALPTH